MTEYVSYISLARLLLARIRCKACGVAVELPVDDLGKVTSCPGCRADLRDARGNNGLFTGLANAVREALSRGSVAEVEFVLPEKP